MAAESKESSNFRNLVAEFFWQEGENLNQRTDWFLLFHAILFEAFLSAERPVYSLSIGLFGVLTSYLWFLLGIRQVWNLAHLRKCLENDSIMDKNSAHVVRELLKAREQNQPRLMRWIHSTPSFSILIPLGCLLVWLVLLIENLRGMGVAAAATIIVVSTVMARWLANWPKISPEAVSPIAPPGNPDDKKTV